MEMPDPDREQAQALTEAIVRLIRRVEQVEDRLVRLEKSQGLSPSVEPLESPIPVSPPPLPIETEIPQAPPPIPEPVAPPIPSSSAEPPHLETRMGLTWINRIGVLTLVIGVAFFFKYAIDNQWIGETGRVVLGV